MNYRSVAQLNRDVLNWLSVLPDDIDLFVGIPRSGMLVATLLGLHANRRVAELGEFLKGNVMDFGASKKEFGVAGAEAKPIRKILVIDDSIYSGREMGIAKRQLSEIEKGVNILYGVVYASPNAKHQVDLYYEVVPFPRLFEWNMMHHSCLPQACVDIDGVLCRDPSEEENDDGEKYENFLSKVPLLRRPSLKIGWLVTCRLEKYRGLTENWLRTNGIAYDKLVMMDLPDKAARIASGGHAAHKAAVYKSCSAEVFIESSAAQAGKIARASGKYVICLETGESIAPGAVSRLKMNFYKKSGNLKWRWQQKLNLLLKRSQ
jgi:uncharacterized HAD superfamily protein